MESIRISAVICARNEGRNIASTIKALQSQTLSPEQIIVVNDGSTDDTGEIAESLGCVVISLPFHQENFVGRPELAERINAGLEIVDRNNTRYVLILGGDHPLPPDYIEQVVSRMESDEKLVVASGRIKGEPYEETMPRGSGRLVRVAFWGKLNRLQYPIIWGWEPWLCYKAQQAGYETKCFHDITSLVERPTGKSSKEIENWGKGMYALGYDWKYALGRCAITGLKSPKMGAKMFWGWFRHKGVEHSDVADWVNKMQKKTFWGKVRKVTRHGGRK